ncbi:MAG TPA: hypothetical protein VFS56_10325 [Gemmatimonadaceae bacterium]|nr:hypothetical protein [Gemmatimonadaceae bacterium]
MSQARSLAAMAGMALLGALSFPIRGQTQHQHDRPPASGPGDTLASAPTTPSRPATDSARVADSLLRTCRQHESHSLDAYSDCIASGLSALSSAGNIALALGTLDRLLHDEPSLSRIVHPLAHALGYAVQSTPRTASLLLAQCDDRYQSGCYHGILQRYFATRMGMPLAQAVLTAPCDPFRGNAGHFRLFACLHGTGHGLMMYHRYDARAALPDCDRLAAEWDRSSCYGGVFMEHNMGARMQAFGEGDFGMHRHSTPASAVTLFKPGDLHYPCNATPERYRRECYSLQADIILPALKHDYRRAAKICDEAGATPLVRACYSGLGRNASGGQGSDFDGIMRRCASGSASGSPFCYEGAVRQLAYAASELPRGTAFCRALAASESRMRCWAGLGLQIGGFFVGDPARRSACQSDRAADVEACLNGAGVGGVVKTNDDL